MHGKVIHARRPVALHDIKKIVPSLFVCLAGFRLKFGGVEGLAAGMHGACLCTDIVDRETDQDVYKRQGCQPADPAGSDRECFYQPDVRRRSHGSFLFGLPLWTKPDARIYAVSH